MSTMMRVLVVLTAFLAIVVSALSISGAAQWAFTKETNEMTQQQAQAAIVARMNLEAMMATALAMKDDALKEREQTIAKLQEKSGRLADELATKSTDLARRTNEAVAAEAGRKKLEEILAVNMAELTNTQKHNQALNDQNIGLQTRNQRLASRNLEVTSENTVLTDENRNLQEKLYASEQTNKELQQLIASGKRVLPEAATAAGVLAAPPTVAGPINGEVVGVEGGYVNINVGETSGVVSGMTFMVYRGDTYVGDVKVMNVRAKEAGGKVTMVRPGHEVQRGDRVAFGLEGH